MTDQFERQSCGDPDELAAQEHWLAEYGRARRRLHLHLLHPWSMIMTTKLRAKGPWWELSPYVRSREAFTTHGALRSEVREPWDHNPVTGQLPADWLHSVRHATYIVYSYDTPIAWYGLAGWVVPDVKYSATTSAHQTKIRTCIPEYTS